MDEKNEKFSLCQIFDKMKIFPDWSGAFTVSDRMAGHKYFIYGLLNLYGYIWHNRWIDTSSNQIKSNRSIKSKNDQDYHYYVVWTIFIQKKVQIAGAKNEKNEKWK